MRINVLVSYLRINVHVLNTFFYRLRNFMIWYGGMGHGIKCGGMGIKSTIGIVSIWMVSALSSPINQGVDQWLCEIEKCQQLL